ncbi:MAG: AAA family ATPase [Hyphomonadaceae bacterium]
MGKAVGARPTAAINNSSADGTTALPQTCASRYAPVTRGGGDDVERHDVFLSYSRENANEADLVCEELTRAGLDVWRDITSVRGGSDWPEAIVKAIDGSSYTLFLWSEHSVTSRTVRQELQYSFELGKPIIPLRLDASALPNTLQLLLAGKQRIEARNGIPSGELQSLAGLIRPKRRRAAKVVSVLNMKGGVGKTTLAANLFGVANEYFHKSVLLVDLDPQYNLTQLVVPAALHGKRIERDFSIVSGFEPGIPLGCDSPAATLTGISESSEEPIDPLMLGLPLLRPGAQPRFDIVPGQFEILKYALPQDMKALESAKLYFRTFIKRATRHYDLIVIDASPSSSFIHDCVFCVATHILCPIKPDKYSELGVQSVDRLLREVFKPKPMPEMLYIMNSVELNNEGAARKPIDVEFLSNWHRISRQSTRTIKQMIPPSEYLRAKPVEERFAELADTLAYRRNGNFATRLRTQLRSATEEILLHLGELNAAT